MLQNIAVSRYGEQKPNRAWDGSIEPDDRSWILFIDVDNIPQLWLHRDIGAEEAVARGLTPKDLVTKKGIGGEYVPADQMPAGEKPTSNVGG